MGAILKRWTGSAWEAKPLKYWNGSAWVEKPLKYWNGSAWVGGAAATTYADTFDRADANLEASPVASGGWSWAHDGLIAAGLQIVSNQLRCNTSNTTGTAYRTPALASADQYVQYKAATASLSSGPFVCCRMADRSNFVGVRNDSGTVEVFRRVAGTLSSLWASAGGTIVVGDTVRLEVSGSNFRVLKNGAEIKPSAAIGATLTATEAGICARTTTGTFFNDFQAGTL